MSFVSFRLSVEDKELLGKVCAGRGEDVSGFVRRCIRKELARMGYYPKDVMKALEMENVEKEVVEI